MEVGNAAMTSSIATQYLINHVFLPPKLPSRCDLDASHEVMLVQTALDSLSSFRTVVGDDQRRAVDDAVRVLQNFLDVHEPGEDALVVSQLKLEDAIQSLNGLGRSCGFAILMSVG
jgi:hypothetical protein